MIPLGSKRRALGPIGHGGQVSSEVCDLLAEFPATDHGDPDRWQVPGAPDDAAAVEFTVQWAAAGPLRGSLHYERRLQGVRALLAEIGPALDGLVQADLPTVHPG